MKLVVEVVDAHDLIPKDGEGSSSAFVEVDFGNQRSRTRTVHKDLNPVWNQKLSFRLHDPDILPKQSVEACVYNERKSFPGRNFLGRVRVHGANIVRQGEEVLQRFQLEKKWLFSSIKGDLALRLYISPEPNKTTVTNSTIDPAAPTEALAVESSSLTTDPKPAAREEAELNQKPTEQQSPATVPVAPIMAFQQLTSTYDLVEQVYYLYVRVVKAKDLPPNAISGSCDPYVEVKLGNYKGITRHFDKKSSPEWNQAFAFSKERIQSTVLEVYVKDKEVAARDDYIGRVVFDLNEVPTRVPPDSPLAPQWYRLEDRRGDGKVRGEIMLADVQPNDGSRPPEVFVKAQVGSQVLKTRVCPTRTMSPMWNEDLIFVAAEPFEEHLVLTVEDRVHHTKDDLLGRIVLPLTGLIPMKMKDGRGTTDAYCVAKYGQKWVRTRTIIDSASPRWNEQYTWEVYDPCTVITLGVFDNCHLGGNEKPAAGGGAARDMRIGKVRIRLSTLEMDRIYTHAYPLVVLQPSGVKKMGELHLAVRFTCLSLASVIYLYGHPLLPKMHYVHPFTIGQVDSLRYQAMGIVAARLGRAEPPLRKEAVEYMLDVDSHMWSMRRSKANFFRIMSLLSGTIGMLRWLDDVCHWKNPITTLLVHLSWAEAIHPDELDEEFDTLFVLFCLLAAVVLYVTPFQAVALMAGVYVLRHPRFRSKLPSVPGNFFKRLPSRIDSML
ncbi:hypothetical protein B296_00015712 [Ensete ventricosum]|uniref:C2 domain-containing protein n=1 Tax=Ensete ventricosum TaxID=4639 RepID=A0A427A590_ENSVE|nr:hypothetical protein B296_00015712 [Ensete ventricosum]